MKINKKISYFFTTLVIVWDAFWSVVFGGIIVEILRSTPFKLIFSFDDIFPIVVGIISGVLLFMGLLADYYEGRKSILE
jgi:hypothetical protein